MERSKRALTKGLGLYCPGEKSGFRLRGIEELWEMMDEGEEKCSLGRREWNWSGTLNSTMNPAGLEWPRKAR